MANWKPSNEQKKAYAAACKKIKAQGLKIINAGVCTIILGQDNRSCLDVAVTNHKNLPQNALKLVNQLIVLHGHRPVHKVEAVKTVADIFKYFGVQI